MTSDAQPGFRVRRGDGYWTILFWAMAGPCEILVRDVDKSEAERLASLAFSETRRIEAALSRYRADNIIHTINHSNGAPIEVDSELARLLDYAAECYRLSGGLFDVTSGILRRAWTFDGAEVVPDRTLIDSLRARVGWDKVRWDGAKLQLDPGMEIDLGGLGKEYAVDRVAELLVGACDAPLLVNFGGDLRSVASGPRTSPWIVGIEDPSREDKAVGEVALAAGGLATSGDTRRYCLVGGIRMGHILDPRTGWPVAGAPRSVTVLADFCVEAGFLATLAILHGAAAEEFLKVQSINGYCFR